MQIQIQIQIQIPVQIQIQKPCLAPAEELAVQLELVLTDVQQEGAACPDQAGVVPGVDGEQLLDGAADTGPQQLDSALQVVLLKVTQQAPVLIALEIYNQVYNLALGREMSTYLPCLHVQDDWADPGGGCSELAVEEGEGCMAGGEGLGLPAPALPGRGCSALQHPPDVRPHHLEGA